MARSLSAAWSLALAAPLALVACASSPPPAAGGPSPGPSASPGDAPAQAAAPEPSAPATDKKGRSFADCPKVGPAPAAAGGALSGQKRHDEITGILTNNRDKFRCCYDVARASNPSLKGSYLLEILLKPDGSIKSVSQRKGLSDISDEPMTGCMIQVAQSLSFPASAEGKETTVPYQFGFTPGGGR